MNGEEFLNKLYKDLHLNGDVIKKSNSSDTPKEQIAKYMDRLESMHNRATTKSRKNLILKFYYDKYVIKEDKLRGLSLEQKENIINAQKDSLKSWINYLTNDNARYPMWAKYWAFQGMLKIGTYDEEHNVYGKRSDSTIAPFVEANPAVIAKCIEMMKEFVDEKKITDEDVKQLVERGNFQKMYMILLNKSKTSKSLQSGNDGIWVKYNYGSKEDAEKLCNSLQGYNNPWCTCNLATAIDQVCGGVSYAGGDFYVYYTKNENNEYKYPRIAIRMDGHNHIGEIRGVDESQNLEEGLEDIVNQKLDEMTFVDEEEKEDSRLAVQDSKTLTKLNQQKEIITNEEDIKFLFEIDREIEGFGWEKDPRIEKIKSKSIINDREILMSAVSKDVSLLAYASDDLKKDKEFMLKVVSQDGLALKYVIDNLKNDKEVVLTSVSRYGDALKYASEDLKKDKEVVLAAVREYSRALKYASDDLKNDKEVILTAVSRYDDALKYASDNLKNDKEVVLTSVSRYGDALKYASDNLKNDKEVVLTSVSRYGDAIKYASDNLKNDKEVVLTSVSRYGDAIKYASDRLKNDRDVVLSSIKNENTNKIETSKLIIEDINDKFKLDKEILYESIKRMRGTELIERLFDIIENSYKDDYDFMKNLIYIYPDSFKYASDRLKDNKEFVMNYLSKDWYWFMSISDRLKNDKDVVLMAVKQRDSYNNVFELVADKFSDDKEVVLAASIGNPYMLEFASDKLRDDKEVILTAITKGGFGLQYASDRLKDDRGLAFIAIKECPEEIESVSERLKKDRELIITAVNQTPEIKDSFCALKFVKDEYKDDKEIVLMSVSHNGYSFIYASDRLKRDNDIITVALNNEPRVFAYVPKNLRVNYSQMVDISIQNQIEFEEPRIR